MKKKSRIGSSFDDFLKEEGIYEEVTARAIKRVIARQLGALMDDEGLTKTQLAKRMKTSRAQLDRLFDPDKESVMLGTLTRTAQLLDGSCGWSLCEAETGSARKAEPPLSALQSEHVEHGRVPLILEFRRVADFRLGRPTGPRRDRHVLLPVDREAHRRRRDAGADIDLP